MRGSSIVPSGRRKTIEIQFRYGEETINSVVCQLIKLNFIREALLELAAENIQIWFDNFIEATFANNDPYKNQCCVC